MGGWICNNMGGAREYNANWNKFMVCEQIIQEYFDHISKTHMPFGPVILRLEIYYIENVHTDDTAMLFFAVLHHY